MSVNTVYQFLFVTFNGLYTIAYVSAHIEALKSSHYWEQMRQIKKT